MTAIKSALTPEEWARFVEERDELTMHEPPEHAVLDAADSIRHAHGRAAAILNGQPFGFTWEDVDLLRSVQPDRAGFAGEDRDAKRLDNLADRIAALLAPR